MQRNSNNATVETSMVTPLRSPPYRRSHKCGAWLATARTRLLRRLYRQAQSKSRQDQGEGIESRIAALGKCPVQRLAGEASFVGECGHTAYGVNHGAQCNGNCARVTVLKHGFKVCRDLGLGSQVIRCSVRTA